MVDIAWTLLSDRPGVVKSSPCKPNELPASTINRRGRYTAMLFDVQRMIVLIEQCLQAADTVRSDQSSRDKMSQSFSTLEGGGGSCSDHKWNPLSHTGDIPAAAAPLMSFIGWSPT